MMKNLTYSRELYEKSGIKKEIIEKLIDKHRGRIAEKMAISEAYYNGKHSIAERIKKSRKQANNKITCNHARYITDIATGYFMGNPISYTIDEGDIDKLTDILDYADSDSADSENALNMSVYGVGYEYIYADSESNIKIKSLNPKHSFIVVDDTIEENELFAVYYEVIKDDVTNKVKKIARVFTDSEIWLYSFEGDKKEEGLIGQHYFESVPIVQYKNNINCIGDFEQQISLIDAYNTLASDRINDKEQFLDALLIIYGGQLADTEEADDMRKALKENGILEMPNDSKVEYLVNTLNETSVEVLRKAIEEDIHKFSYVPCLTDDSFAGNSSGVAMEYKLLGLEMITKIKIANYRRGLKKRFKLICNFMGKKAVNIDSESIIATFTKGLPKNLVELSQMVNSLDGIVSRETLIGQLPFVEDVNVEMEKVAEEQSKIVGIRDNEMVDDEE